MGDVRKYPEIRAARFQYAMMWLPKKLSASYGGTSGALTPVGHPRGISGPVNPCPASDSFPARCVRGSCSKTMDGSRQVLHLVTSDKRQG
eukprot:scaffold8693_cov119-Isochrysis_galbana.AAC.1